MHREPAPARPPEAIFTKKNIPKSVFGEYFGNNALMVSLKAKLKAWVGKYLITFVKFPLQKALRPCSL
jgi:hypothetical protein